MSKIPDWLERKQNELPAMTEMTVLAFRAVPREVKVLLERFPPCSIAVRNKHCGCSCCPPLGSFGMVVGYLPTNGIFLSMSEDDTEIKLVVLDHLELVRRWSGFTKEMLTKIMANSIAN